MSPDDGPPQDPDAYGAMTAPTGTPYPVDVSHDRRTRRMWLTFLGGPVAWFGHFMLVYLVAEAGCTGDGPGLRLLDPPVPAIVTAVATVLAAVGCLWAAAWTIGARDVAGDEAAATLDTAASERRRSLAFVGALLWLLSFAAIVFVGVSAAVFPGC